MEAQRISWRRTVVVIAFAALAAVAAWMSGSPTASRGADASEHRAGKAPREIAAMRTETSRTFRLPGGTMRTVISPAPVNYRHSGRWVPIDNTLEPSADG
jgi:hypothetical protein